MSIDPRKIINSPSGLKFAYLLGKSTPYWLGYRIAYFIADRISSRKEWKLTQIVRCNQWVVHGDNLTHSDLDGLVKNTFRSIATSIFDFYHTINNPSASLRLIEEHPAAVEFIKRPEFGERGVVIAGIHMSNFDMAFQVGGLAGIKAMSLTVTEFNAAYKKQYEMRKKSGLNVVPASIGSIKRAVEHLKGGGLVITAVDWPDPNSAYRPKFFGYPAALPVHYVFLALKAHVPIVVAAIRKRPDGKYYFYFSEPIEMLPYPDRQQEIIRNVEKILHVAEEIIRNDPCQWSMTFPVWPDMMAQVPNKG
jgi:KDO2-lipid IV(A) lauroyltransferase